MDTLSDVPELHSKSRTGGDPLFDYKCQGSEDRSSLGQSVSCLGSSWFFRTDCRDNLTQSETVVVTNL